jgi:hypothetical protein
MAKKEERKIEKIISKNAFEIAYALCRLAQILKNENFSQNFESQALKILNFSIQKDFDNLKTSLLNLEYFIHLAVELNILKINLAEILLDEISALNKYIIEAEEEILLSQSEIENVLKNGNNKKAKFNKFVKKEFIDEIPKDSAIKQNFKNYYPKDSAIKQNFKNYYPKDSAIIQDPANNLRKDSAIDFGKIKNSAIDVRDSAIDDKDSAIDPNIEIDLALKEDSAKEQTNNIFFDDFSFENNTLIDSVNIKKDSANENINSEITKDLAMNPAMNSANDSEYSAKILNPVTNSAIDLENSAIDSAKDYANRNNSAMNSAIVENSAIENNSAKEVLSVDKDLAMISITEPVILLGDSAINSIPEKAPSTEPSGFKHISEIIKETNTTNPAFSEETEESFSIKKSVFWERISHFDEFKLKDIENIFPDISERTLRYYLSELVSLGFIEKIGTSGRNVIYRVKK